MAVHCCSPAEVPQRRMGNKLPKNRYAKLVASLSKRHEAVIAAKGVSSIKQRL